MTAPGPVPASWPDSYGDPSWFLDARFGMFIHWGLYSVAARHEWVMYREAIPPSVYEDSYFRHFDPDLYEPATWARLARQAGMRYVVVTTKHHEGFALWDSKVTDYSAPHSPAGRDLLDPLVDAFRAEGLRIGFYHSLIDWHHPDFPVDGLHPQRGDESARAEAREVYRYADYLHAQVRELLTGYGPIDYLWFDFSYPEVPDGGKGPLDWRSEELERLVLDLQPDIILNDRLGLGRGVITPEQEQPGDTVEDDVGAAVWEVCHTLNGSWGYDRDNLEWKSPAMLVALLVDAVAKGGNMLLNVGPNGRGELGTEATDRLRAIGDWMRLHERSIRGAGRAAFTPPPDARYTQRGDRLYLHLLAWKSHVVLPGLGGKVKAARLLADGSEISMREGGGRWAGGAREDDLTLTLPGRPPALEIPVIELLLREGT